MRREGQRERRDAVGALDERGHDASRWRVFHGLAGMPRAVSAGALHFDAYERMPAAEEGDCSAGTRARPVDIGHQDDEIAVACGWAERIDTRHLEVLRVEERVMDLERHGTVEPGAAGAPDASTPPASTPPVASNADGPIGAGAGL